MSCCRRIAWRRKMGQVNPMHSFRKSLSCTVLTAETKDELPTTHCNAAQEILAHTSPRNPKWVPSKRRSRPIQFGQGFMNDIYLPKHIPCQSAEQVHRDLQAHSRTYHLPAVC